ncbi:hypothetical protein [Haloferula sp. A504]|uniref:hypothetical protein n=1 Tax=Haloferula sp. A504 TaxID=3373601 RepID=UPI0031BE2750|nr:phytanoyl-CoA dioxygenase family protein [Verrucomicrobiaceae bacterium E54]
MNSSNHAPAFARDGFVKVNALLQAAEVDRLLALYDRFLDGSIKVGSMRADLGAGTDRKEGATLHYSRGNTTPGHRRALILNFRPTEMIRLERELGFDHGKSDNTRRNRNKATE